jgi:hypothetical protein
MLPAVEHALARLPAPVSDLILRECYILAVGASLRGWTCLPLATEGLCPVMVSGAGGFDSIVEVVCHEASHRWNGPDLVAGVTAPTEAARAEFLAYAAREGWPLAAFEARAAEDERLAELCAAAWSGADA